MNVFKKLSMCLLSGMLCFGLGATTQAATKVGNGVYEMSTWADEGAETLAELYARTGDFIQKVLLPEINAGKNVLIVGHGAMNLSIINQLMNIPVERFWENMQGNCELKEIDLECMGKRNEEIQGTSYNVY